MTDINTFDYLYIKGNVISSNRTSMQKRGKTIQHVCIVITIHVEKVCTYLSVVSVQGILMKGNLK